MTDLLTFSLAQKAVIHINAGQALPNRPVDQRGCHRRIHTARKRKKNSSVLPYGIPDLSDRCFRKSSHGPAAVTVANVVEEIVDQLPALFRVRHFRMKLHAVDLSLDTGHGCNSTVIRLCDRMETFRAHAALPCMAHPAGGFGFHAFQNSCPVRHSDGHPAIFPLRGTLNLTAQHLTGQLHPVADAQNRHSLRIDRGIAVRRIRVADTGRTAGEDNACRMVCRNLLCRDAPRHHFRIHVVFSYTPGNELRVLSSEVQNQDLLFFHLQSTSFLLSTVPVVCQHAC